MRKIKIGYYHIGRSQNPDHYKDTQRNPTRIKLNCSKCGTPLNVGDIAYRTVRRYLCQTCGENAEI